MNNSFENAEKGLKRWLKKDAKITMATVVAFLITGAVSYGAGITQNDIPYTVNGTENITLNENITVNSGDIKGITVGEGAYIKVVGGRDKNLTVENGTGFYVEKNGKIYYDTATTVNVGENGTGFYTNAVSAEGDYSIHFTEGNVNIEGGTGIKAENGRICFGNGGGIPVTVAVDKGTGISLKDSQGDLFYDSVVKVSEGTGVLLEGNSILTNNSTKNDRGIIVSGANAVGITGTGTVKGEGLVTASNQGRGIVVDKGQAITYESGTVNVRDNGIGAEVNGGNLKFLEKTKVSVNGENAVGIKFTKSGKAEWTKGEITVEKGVGLLASGKDVEGKHLDTKYNNNAAKITVSGKDSVGLKAEENGHMLYSTWNQDERGVFVSNKGIGFYAAGSGTVELDGGHAVIEDALGFKADGTGKLIIGNGTGNIQNDSGTKIEVTNGTGIALFDSATAILREDAGILLNNGIGADLKGKSTLTFNTPNSAQSILVENNSIGINVSGENENNNVTVNGTGKITVAENGIGLKVSDSGNILTYESGTINVGDNGIGAELDGGTLNLGEKAIVSVTGENAIGITGTGKVINIGTVDVKQGIGVLASGTGKSLTFENFTDKNTSGSIKISGDNTIGFKAENGAILTYDDYNHEDKCVNVSNNTTGFYAAENGTVKLLAGIVKVNNAVGLKADGTGKLIVGNGGVTINLNITEKGTGISLSDSATAILNTDSILKAEDGIGVDLKGTSVLTNNSTSSSRGIRVSNNSIGINVSGAGENNNVTVNGNKDGIIYIENNGIGLKASNAGNVLNYESGTVITSSSKYGVVAEDGATIHFGNDLVGTKQADGTSFDTFLDVKNGKGIRVGQNSTVTVGKDVKFALSTGTTGVEIDGGTFENKTTIDIGKDQIGIEFIEEDGKAINTGKIVIEAGGTGFVGEEDKNNEVINNGTIVVTDTKDPDKSTITTGVGITSNGTIQIGDISDDLTDDMTDEQIKEEILDRLVGITKDDIKGLITDEHGDVIFVAGTDIGTEIDEDKDGKVTVDEIKDKDVAFKTDEETSEDPTKPTDPTETGTVTITGEDGDELINKVINVGGNLVITGPTGPSTGTGLVLDDVQINMYDKDGEKGIEDEELTFTGKVTVDNTDSGKTIDIGNDKLVIGTGTGKTDVTFIGTEITGEDGKSQIVIVGNDDKLILDDTDVTINIGPDPTTGIGTGTLVIGTNVGTEDINVDNMIVTGTGNETGEVKTDKLVVTGGGELTSTGIDAGTVTFEDGKIDVSGDGGEIKTDEIIVEDNKYGEIFGGKINVGTGGIKVGVNAELTLDGNTNVGTDDDGDININVGTGGIFTNKGSFTGNGNLDIDNGSYNFETKGNDEDPAKSEKVKITGDIFVDNGSLSFKGDGIIDIGGDDNKGTISVGTDPDGNFADVSFAPESKIETGNSIKFVTGTNGSINIALGDSKDENSILGNPGTGTTLDFGKDEVVNVKFNTDRLTVAKKEIALNTDKVGEYPFITGLDQNDLGDEKAQADADYIAEYIKGENGDPDKVVLSYNESILYGYGEEIGEIGSAFRVINDRVSEAVKKMVGANATRAEKKEAKAKLADSIYTANIYSETVRMSYDNLKMSEDAVLSLKHRTAKGELAGEGKALHSKTEYEREAKVFGNTSSDSKITGLLGAVEYGLSDNTRVGGVFSGSIQDLDAENGKADGNAFYVGAYINKHTSKYEMTAGAGYQFNKFETDNTYLGNTGTEKYDSQALSAYVHGRRIVDLGDGLSFQPKAKLSYSLIEQDDVKDSFMETKDAEIGIFEAEAGFDVVKSIYTDKAKVDVVFGTSLAKAMGDTDKEFTGSFFNETEKLGFKTAGAEIVENKIKFNVGAEVSYESGLFWNGEFNYSFGSKDTETYGVSVGIGYKF